jgi:hypothetical protein
MWDFMGLYGIVCEFMGFYAMMGFEPDLSCLCDS